MSLHINWSRGVYARRILPCPVCKRRTRHVVFVDFSPYYAGHVTCVSCGDAWSEGELMERPFRRGWRKENQKRAKQHWANGMRWNAALAEARTHWAFQ